MKRALLLFAFALSACAPQTIIQTSVAPGTLLPYVTRTPSSTPEQPDGLVISFDTPVPSPTPFIYEVQAGETMLGIAERFGVSVEALRTANPDVYPNSMSIGTELLIPGDSDNPTDAPSPTPVPVPVEQIECYPTADSGLWCFVLIHNDTYVMLENLSAQVTLVDANGQEFLSAQALSPLNILPPDATLPLTVYFPPKIPSDAKPIVQILSAIRLFHDDARYLSATTQNTLVQVDSSGRSARVSGTVLLTGDDESASLIWVVAVAYDEHGRIVGVRRWESENGALQFEFDVSSLAGRIQDVDFIVEARP